jgi:hypothetical protein
MCKYQHHQYLIQSNIIVFGRDGVEDKRSAGDAKGTGDAKRSSADGDRDRNRISDRDRDRGSMSSPPDRDRDSDRDSKQTHPHSHSYSDRYHITPSAQTPADRLTSVVPQVLAEVLPLVEAVSEVPEGSKLMVLSVSPAGQLQVNSI